MQTISINFIVPEGWHELSDEQLRFVYQLIAENFDAEEIKTLALLKWSGTRVVGRQESGAYLLPKGKTLFEATPLTIAELLPHLAWLGATPTVPVRLSKINRRQALPADFSEVPFETFIICDNLYQGYLQTQNDELLDQLGATLYGKSMTFKPYERINIFYWFAALKDTFSRKFPAFFQPIDAATGDSPLPADRRALKENVAKMDGIAVFSDDIRDAIKDHYSNAADRGFATGKPGNEETVKIGLVYVQMTSSLYKRHLHIYSTVPSMCELLKRMEVRISELPAAKLMNFGRSPQQPCA